MHDAHLFLKSLTIVLAVAAVTTVVFQRLRQPVVLGYIVAGLIVGPHVPVPIVADRAIVQTLSELGVILLMFSLGLEFRLGKLWRLGPTAGTTALLQSGLMVWLGFLTGRLFGWTLLESVFAGAVIAISSTTIIAKVFDEQRIGGRVRELVVGILLIEDLIAVVLIAALTAVATGAGLTAGELGATLGRLGAFLLALVVVGLLVVPRFMRLAFRLGRPEATLVASVGVCFSAAYAAQEFGYSVALGAFLGGSLVAESGHAEDVEHLVHPVRDMFAAIFFVSVGLALDPRVVADHWLAVMVFTAVVVVGKVVGVSAGAFLTGSGTRTALQAGMSLAQIGEFSFIIAVLGVSLGATREFLFPIAVAVSAVTTLTTPWLIRAAEPVAALVDRKLPRPLQTLAMLYGAWIERLRTRSTERPAWVRMVRLIVLDVGVLSGIVIATVLGRATAAAALTDATGLAAGAAAWVVLVLAIALCMPLVIGIGRLARRLGDSLARAALPTAEGKADFDFAPRRALSITVQLASTLAAGIIVVAVTQPFLPSYSGPLGLTAVVVAFGIAVWRSATNLEGHVRAGAQTVVSALAKASQSRATGAAPDPQPMAAVRELLPGMGAPLMVEIPPGSPGAGRSLAELNLRGRTGATVLAIARRRESIAVPAAGERLQPGDVIALAGTEEAVQGARALLLGGPEP